MSEWLEKKYIGLLSSSLSRFKRKSGNIYNFRCVFCGDSTKDITKCRAYFFEKKGSMNFYCHNCNRSMGFQFFLKEFDFNLYGEYRIEKIKERDKVVSTDAKLFEKSKLNLPQLSFLNKLKNITQLSEDDEVRKLVVSRKIPERHYDSLYSCENFQTFVNQILPDKFSLKSIKHDEMRLLIPFFDKKGTCFAFQGRAIKPSKLKYITVVLNEGDQCIWGLDRVNFNEKVYCFEGPIDAMFVDNSIATAGGDMVSSLAGLPKESIVIVYDNESRSFHTKKKMQKAISNGFKVCIWPEYILQKDVNDMILSGTLENCIKNTIDSNTYQGLSATFKLNSWSKV